MKTAISLCGVAVAAFGASAAPPRIAGHDTWLARPVSSHPRLLESGEVAADVCGPRAAARPFIDRASANPAPVLAHPPADTRAPSSGAASVPRTAVLSAARGSLSEQAYTAMVRRIARRYSVEWELVMAIIASESGGDPSAVSPAGAVGLMQLMPETATELGVDPWDPEQNVEGAVRYLSSLLSTFGSVDLTLIAYNAGPGFAKRYREGTVELGAETRAFLTKVGVRSTK